MKSATGSAAIRGGLELVCVSRLKKKRQVVRVVFKEKMFTRYPGSVLRHELSHSTHVATFKVGMPMRSNDAGSGSPPGAAASQGMPRAGGEWWPRQGRAVVTHPSEKGVEMCLSTGVQGEVLWVVVGTSAPYCGASSSEGWGFPPTRAGAPEICQKSEGTFG